MATENSEDLLEEKNRALQEIYSNRLTTESSSKASELRGEILELERTVAAKNDVSHAIEWPLGDLWHWLGNPLIVGDSLTCALIFDLQSRKFAVLLFDLVKGYKLESTSGEVLDAHPMKGRGISPHRTFIIKKLPGSSN